MRKYILATILILATCSLFAACGSNETLANSAIPAISGLNATPANVTARVWIQGLNNVANAAGTDSDGVPSVDDGCGFGFNYVLLDGPCAGAGAGQYFVYTDWLDPAYDGCPLATGSERATLLAYDVNGNYVLQSITKDEGYANWDDIGTSVAAPLTAATANPDPDGTGPLGPLTLSGDEVGNQIDIAFLPFANSVLQGDHALSVPATIPTQYVVWFYTGAAAPLSFAVPGAGWSQGSTYAIGTLNAANCNWPGMPAPGLGVWFGRRLIFEGTPLPFVSTSVATIVNPSGAPVIASASAVRSGLDTNVTWTSSDESRVTGYQVFWAPVGGEFTATGSMINTLGNGHTYTTSVRIPSAGSYTVKVGAHLVDGTTEYSAPATISSTITIKDRTRVTAN